MNRVALAAVLIAVSCGGGTGASDTSSAAVTTASVTTTSRVVEPPDRLTDRHLLLVSLDDQELPSDLMHLVPGPLGFAGIPELFLDNRFNWRGQGFAPRREEAPQVFVALRLRDSADQADAQFDEGAAAARSGDGPTSHSDVTLFDVPGFGEEAVGVHLHRGVGSIQRWETLVAFRDGPLIVTVTISRSERAEDVAAAIEMGRILEDRLQRVKSGELAPEASDPLDRSDFAFPVAPQRQLNTFAFEATLIVDDHGEVTVTGLYERRNRMRCEVAFGGESHVFYWDGTKTAVDTGEGMRLLAPDDALGRLVRACPGHLEFFDTGFPIEELALYDFEGGDFVFEPDVVRTSHDGMPALLYVADRPPRAHFASAVLGPVDEVAVLFHEFDGWAIQMTLAGEIDAGFLFPVDDGSFERFEMEYEILRANDPSIVVDLPGLFDAGG
jgi:hypothetical protein